ncbi:hypothetical protein QYE76_017735 [Lolium multiflorum]|uniref:DUF220 domain-containing protein n=1 Tax=Lolium multiflorum TaxID=4521 RepID=A0AAD8VCK3_LOLMU|nr:hypothetical protein QYE76_017735 [Lolium multiflorum]
MKKFEGCWKIEPLFVDKEACLPLDPNTLEEYDSCTAGRGRVGSAITLDQLIEPAILPPQPIAWYKRVAILRNGGDREENLDDMEILLDRQDKKYKLRSLDGVIVYNQVSVSYGISSPVLASINRNMMSHTEVISRKVLLDEGSRQVVEVEQAAIWKFLWWSGILSVHVFVDQNRRNHTV